MSARGQLDGKLAQNATSAGIAVDRDGFGYRQPGMQLQESLSEADFFSLSIESSAYLVPQNTLAAHSQFQLTDAKKV
jgi:hypothetical protein